MQRVWCRIFDPIRPYFKTLSSIFFVLRNLKKLERGEEKSVFITYRRSIQSGLETVERLVFLKKSHVVILTS